MDLLEIDVPLQSDLRHVDGGYALQVYMVVLVVWLAKVFETELVAIQQKWLPRFGFIRSLLNLFTPAIRAIEITMLVLAVLLGAYTGFYFPR